MTIVVPMCAVWVGIGFMLISIVQSFIRVRLTRKQMELASRRQSILIKSDPDDFTLALVTKFERLPLGEKRKK